MIPKKFWNIATTVVDKKKVRGIFFKIKTVDLSTKLTCLIHVLLLEQPFLIYTAKYENKLTEPKCKTKDTTYTYMDKKLKKKIQIIEQYLKK